MRELSHGESMEGNRGLAAPVQAAQWPTAVMRKKHRKMGIVNSDRSFCVNCGRPTTPVEVTCSTLKSFYNSFAIAGSIDFAASMPVSANMDYEKGYQFALQMIAKDLADIFARENPRGFNREQFLTNCGITQEVQK